MAVGTVSALNLYNFQNTAKNSGKSSAVLQALSTTYAQSSAASGSDPMSQLLTTASLAPVVNAMSSLTSGSGSTGSLQAYKTYGGLTATNASLLFSNDGASKSSFGFESALGGNSAMALTAYQTSLTYATTTSLTPIQQSIQDAQNFSNSYTLNLYG